MALDLEDKSGNSNTLTNNNGATEVTSSLPFAASTSAADLELDSSQYFSASDSTSLSITGDITIEGWIKFETLPSVSGQTAYLVNKDATGQRSYVMCITTSDKLMFQYRDAAGTGATRWDSTSAVIASTGVWFHVACVVTVASHDAVFYKDGSSIAITDGSQTATDIKDGTSQLNIGAAADLSEFLDGQVDDIRIWSGTRTGTEIANNYNVELTGSETGLKAYWPFESLAAATSIKTVNGLAKASVKTVDGLAIASVKTWDGLA